MNLNCIIFFTNVNNSLLFKQLIPFSKVLMGPCISSSNSREKYKDLGQSGIVNDSVDEK